MRAAYPKRTRRAARTWWALWVFAAPLVAVMLHMPSSNYLFAGNDHEYIDFNKDVHPFEANTTWLGLFRHDTLGINTTAYLSNKEFRPLTVISWRLDSYLFGAGKQDPWGYHIHNILLHGAVVALFQQVAALVVIDSELASIAAILFATHPAHIHNVCNISGRGELLSAMFQFAAILVWSAKEALDPYCVWSIYHTLLLLMFLLCVALSSLAHEVGCLTIPLVLVMQSMLADPGGVLCGFQNHFTSRSPHKGSKCGQSEDGDQQMQGHCSTGKSHNLQHRDSRRCRPKEMAITNLIWHTASWAALGVGISLWRLQNALPMTNSILPPFVDNPMAHLTGVPRILSLLYLHLLHVGVLLFPFQLSADYSYNVLPPVTSLLTLQGLVAVAGIPILAWGLWNMWQQGDLRALFAYTWLTLQLLPFSGVLLHARNSLLPRSLFLPSAALCILLALMAVRLKDGNATFARSFLLVVAMVFACTAIVQMPIYQNHSTYYTTALAQTPLNAKINTKMAGLITNDNPGLSSEITRKRVIELYAEALRIYPEYTTALLDLGKLHLSLGDRSSGEKYLLKAAELGSAEGHYEMGIMHMHNDGAEGCEDAEWHFNKALEINPDEYRAYTNTGICRFWNDDMDAASVFLEKALQLTPFRDIGVPADAMAKILSSRGEYDRALRLSSMALDASPTNSNFYSTYAFTLYTAGYYLEAAAYYDKAAELFPDESEMFKRNADAARWSLMNNITLSNSQSLQPQP